MPPAAARSPAVSPTITSKASAREIENYEWKGFRLPGTVVDLTQANSSEHNLRNLYRRWAQFMEAESWSSLAPWRSPACRPSRRVTNGTDLRRESAIPVAHLSCGFR